MCGIYGYISKQDEFPVDVPTLEDLGLDNESRGKDACGVAWLDSRGRLQSAKRTGAICEHLDMLQSCDGARAVIGHTRLATHGSPKLAVNNHPHLLDNGAGFLVHNGVILNHRLLIDIARAKPLGSCDTEGLALLASSKTAKNIVGKDVVRRLKWAVSECEQSGLAIAALWKGGRAALVRAEARPLWIGETKYGWWFSSLNRRLPGRVYEVNPFTAIDFERVACQTQVVVTKAPAMRSRASARYAFANGGIEPSPRPAPSKQVAPPSKLKFGGAVSPEEEAYQRQLFYESMEWRKE